MHVSARLLLRQWSARRAGPIDAGGASSARAVVGVRAAVIQRDGTLVAANLFLRLRRAAVVPAAELIGDLPCGTILAVPGPIITDADLVVTAAHARDGRWRRAAVSVGHAIISGRSTWLMTTVVRLAFTALVLARAEILGRPARRNVLGGRVVRL